MIKILIATPLYPPEIGGPATYTKFLEEELPKNGVEVEVLKFSTVKHLPKFIRHLVYAWKVFKKLKHKDIVYAQDPVSVGFPVAIVSKLFKKKFMIRIAGDYAWEQGQQRFKIKEGIDDFQNNRKGIMVNILHQVQTWVAGQADMVITPSNYFSQLVQNWSKKIKVKTIYNGIDVQFYNDIQPFLKSKKLITAGRLVPWKGFDELIIMMKELPDWSLVIVGNGPDEKKLKNLANQIGVINRIEFTGAVDKLKLKQLMVDSSIFILNTYFESFSFQTVEAMASGLIPIVTNIGSLPEIVEDGKNGFLFNPGDTGSVINKLIFLSKDKNLVNKMSTESKLRAKDFSISRTVDSLVSMINQI
ncbi:MAG: glycosyltransferase family 4 protein [Patescibacteria group bacterium]